MKMPVINRPNLNILGIREPKFTDLRHTQTSSFIEKVCADEGVGCRCFSRITRAKL